MSRGNLNLLARAAAGDPYAQAEAAPLLMRGLRVWFRERGALSLERCLGLPGPTARREMRMAARDYWLTLAHGLCDGDTPWKRSLFLADELARFEAMIWPAWRDFVDPPPEASQLRTALFKAMCEAVKLTRDSGLHGMPGTARQLHEIVKRSADAISQPRTEDESS